MPTTRAHDIAMCPRKAAHDPRMHFVTRAHDNLMCLYRRTPHGHDHQTSVRHQRHPDSSCAQVAAYGTVASPIGVHTDVQAHQMATHARAQHPDAPRTSQKLLEGPRHAYMRVAPFMLDQDIPRSL